MDERRFERAAELFHRLLEEPEQARRALLEQECGEDTELEREVLSLLQADAEALSDERPSLGFAFASSTPTFEPSTTFGRYRIIDVLGRGGMGIVYEAEQDQPKRRVAIKVLPRGFISDQVRRRFEFESEVLARLNHPGIASVYEAGRLPDDGGGELPYFVMELVRGSDLLAFVQEKHLDVRARLELLRSIGEAIHHAHLRGIVHRDLKPANILVDETGRPRVLDFGIARSTASDLQTITQTLPDRIEGTLAYMSPEQTEADPDRLDHRSDVYSLGVVAYELLTGQLPVPVDAKAWTEVLRAIREDPPQPIRQAAPDLPREIGWILGRCLEKEPDRRYASVAEFVEDVERYLDCRPLRAGPLSVSYRLGRFVHRHRALCTVAALALVGLLVGVVALWRAWDSERERRLAEEERRIAERERRLWSDATLAPVLRQRMTYLFPRHRHRIDAMEEWLDVARDLVSREADHRALVEAVISGELEGQPTFLLSDMQKLVEQVEQFTDPETGWIADVEARIEYAGSLPNTLEHPDWQDAIAAVETSPWYDGLTIVPQLGLIPIGEDPFSGFWEFGHVETGEIPTRDDDGQLVIDENTSLVFVLLPGGSFQFGRDVSRSIGGLERTVEPFFLSKYEMTQGQWLRFTGSNPSRLPPGWRAKDEDTPAEQIHDLSWPVEGIDWTTSTRVMRQLGLVLPTEIEWEYATRAGGDRRYSCGDAKEDLIGLVNIGDRQIAEYEQPSAGPEASWLDDGWVLSAKVGTFPPNDFGLHEMMGNLFEWCATDYFPLDGKEIELLDAHERPDYGPERTGRAIRGGSFRHSVVYCASASRYFVQRTANSMTCGLRPARVVTQHSLSPGLGPILETENPR